MTNISQNTPEYYDYLIMFRNRELDDAEHFNYSVIIEHKSTSPKNQITVTGLLPGKSYVFYVVPYRKIENKAYHDDVREAGTASEKLLIKTPVGKLL